MVREQAGTIHLLIDMFTRITTVVIIGRKWPHFLKSKGFEPSETVGMMTAVILEDVSYKFFEQDSFSIFVVVTAGVGNAIDASKSEQHSYMTVPGTINTWIFVNGELTEEAFIQSIMTATEAKIKALNDLKVIDRVTGTIATGTSTDSILIAATQTGEELEFAGTITPLGKLIGKAVYQCTTEAIQKSQEKETNMIVYHLIAITFAYIY